MSEADDHPSLGKHAPVWALWKNPIFRRYCRSRLRPSSFGFFLLITILVAGFLFFVTRAGALRSQELLPADAARLPLIPLLFVQGMLLFLMGTGQVAAGMTAEADEGVLDYQRLAPMTPTMKIVGYLFGLPVREYLLFLATMPFTVWSLWKGEVPLAVCLKLYGVFLSSALLYHVTGLVAGTVVKNRRWAFLITMGLIFFLYTVVPQVAKFGLVYFKYLTLYPTVEEVVFHLVPREMGQLIGAAQESAPNARFFNLNLPQSVFTLISQGILMFTGLVMLWRRWNRNESHLLGRVGAIWVFVWVQLALLGNALPLIDSGDIFPSRELGRSFGKAFTDAPHWSPRQEEAIFMSATYGMVSLALIWVLTLMVTPSVSGQIMGWRRARKLDKNGLSLFSDAATSTPWVCLMSLCGAIGWFVFSQGLVGSSWFSGQSLPLVILAVFVVVLLVGGLAFQGLLEWKEKRVVLLVAVLVGAVPAMAGVVLSVASSSLGTLGSWLAGASPIAAPLYASMSLLPMGGEVAVSMAEVVSPAFWFWLIVWALVTLYFLFRLGNNRRAIAKMTLSE